MDHPCVILLEEQAPNGIDIVQFVKIQAAESGRLGEGNPKVPLDVDFG
ncbi:hypothetical protein ABE099_18450 [Paenibacillus turicensis]